ncbi:hypothetical protein PV05_00133 [Exophiala xenobiotica]|uniref:Uncharacterized protein n=1 Tax=Exophiala xenobiotica TaxID=348802 RepID=A0A0D2DC60_9EURO|nr:uncharacterized protein PV05_00133 [Exophiala xenobiotica]KIW59867.1 hypothetical protein PV05_00133 [Exophiala xenobiotica]
MGLIKTAMVSGVAIYGINKLSKSSERRREQSSPSRNEYRDAQPQYLDGTDGQGYYYVPQGRGQQQQKGQSQGLEFVDRRPSGPQDQPLYLQNNPSSPLPFGHSNNEYMYAPNRAGPPPQYQNTYAYAPREKRSGFVEADEVSGSDFHGQSAHREGGGAALLNNLAQQFLGGDSKSKDKGKDMMKMFSR